MQQQLRSNIVVGWSSLIQNQELSFMLHAKDGVEQKGRLTSVPVSSWIRKSKGGSGIDVDSQEAPQTLFMLCQFVLGPLICTSFTDPRMAASCSIALHRPQYSCTAQAGGEAV